MQTNMTQLAGRIMRRVYVAYALRRLTSPLALKLYALAALAWVLKTAVFVRSVLDNAAGLRAFSEWYSFGVSAFTNAELAVQASSVAALAVAAFLARDLARDMVRAARERDRAVATL